MNKRELIYAFDWDNTLINSHAKGLRCMCKALAEFKIHYTENGINQIFCPDYHKMFAKAKIPQNSWKELDGLWLKYYNSEAKVELFPEVKKVLAEISQNGNIIALITTGERTRVNSELEYLNVKHLFNLIVCREDVIKVKPAPEAIDLLEKKYNRHDVVYIGDHDDDVEMAQNAHVRWYKVDRNSSMEFSKDKNIIKNISVLLDTLR